MRTAVMPDKIVLAAKIPRNATREIWLPSGTVGFIDMLFKYQ